MKILAAVSTMLALAAAPVWAQSVSPPIRQFDVATIETLGRAIYERDQYAWHATDALLAAVPRERLAGTIGWIVVERDGAQVVRFGRGDVSNPEPSYDITFRGDADPAVTEASRAFSQVELAMFRAVALVRPAVTEPCSDRYNSVILPDPDGDGWLVWMFAATTEPGVLSMGGHYRFTVSADGRRIEQSDRLSQSCLMMDGPPPESASADWVMLTTVQLAASNVPL